jgi:hypothetical protein
VRLFPISDVVKKGFFRDPKTPPQRSIKTEDFGLVASATVVVPAAGSL